MTALTEVKFHIQIASKGQPIIKGFGKNKRLVEQHTWNVFADNLFLSFAGKPYPFGEAESRVEAQAAAEAYIQNWVEQYKRERAEWEQNTVTVSLA